MSEDPSESPAFLLRPELIAKFLGMMDTRIDALDDELDKIDNARKNIKAAQNELKEKRDTLDNYHKFLKLKGFGYVKQYTDAFFEEIKEANKDRVVQHDDVLGCDEVMTVGTMVFRCSKIKYHDGECQFAIEEAV